MNTEEYNREYYLKHDGKNRRRKIDCRIPLKDWHSGHKELKIRARTLLLRAVRKDRINKPDHCQTCLQTFGKEHLEGHHHDYSIWWEVSWLCRQCHVNEHLVRRKENASEQGK